MRATSHAYGVVAGDENGLVASTTSVTSAFRSPCFASATVPPLIEFNGGYIANPVSGDLTQPTPPERGQMGSRYRRRCRRSRGPHSSNNSMA
jgi:hypothetical protein